MSAAPRRSVVLALLAALATVVPAATSWAQARPDLVGLTVAEAVEELKARQLQVALVPDEPPDGVDPSRIVVVAQEALFDEVEQGVGPYGYELRLGARVPDVVGQTLADAAATVEELGLLVVTPGAPDTDEVLVAGQTPGAGTLLPFGGRVQLQLVPAVRVPDLVGLTRDQATAALEQLGLSVAVSGGGERPGPVEAQDPAAGTVVPADTRVDVVLGVLPLASVAVPDLRGLGVDAARRLLVDAGLALEPVVEGDPAEARVVSQSPAAGVLVEPGAPVAVRFVAAAVPPADAVLPDEGLPWELLAGTALLAAALGGALVWRPLRAARERAWVRQHVRSRGFQGAPAPPRVLRPRHDLCTAVRVDVHPDPGRQELEEVRR